MPESGKWCFALNEDTHFDGDFDTKEEAIEEAKTCSEFPSPTIYVGKTKALDFCNIMECSAIAGNTVDAVQEKIEEIIGDATDAFFDAPTEDLADAINRVCIAWLNDNLSGFFEVVDIETIKGEQNA